MCKSIDNIEASMHDMTKWYMIIQDNQWLLPFKFLTKLNKYTCIIHLTIGS